MKLFSGTPLSQFGDPAAAKQVAVETVPVSRPAKAKTPKISAPRKPKSYDSAFSPSIPTTPATGARIIAIPRLAIGGRWRVEAMRSLSEPMLLWFTRGQGRITIAGETRGYGAHNAIFVPAGVMHGFEVGAQTFGTALFFGTMTTVTLPTEPTHLRIRDATTQAELSAVIDSIQREMDSGKAGHERATRHHLGLVGVWLERQRDIAADEQRGKPAAAQRLARAYATLMERDFRTGKGVADYAHELGVTPTHLSRVCNQTCGRSASDLLHDRLIFEARRLLSDTRLPVSDISRALGFTSAAYFTRAFQHRTGKTPSSFRKLG